MFFGTWISIFLLSCFHSGHF